MNFQFVKSYNFEKESVTASQSSRTVNVCKLGISYCSVAKIRTIIKRYINSLNDQIFILLSIVKRFLDFLTKEKLFRTPQKETLQLSISGKNMDDYYTISFLFVLNSQLRE